MSDLISREAILKNIEKTRQSVQMMDDTRRASIIMNGMYLCEKAVRNQPSVQPERKKAMWKGEGLTDYRCSLCGFLNTSRLRTKYCPNCGARMAP